jgi:hypothetical protein
MSLQYDTSSYRMVANDQHTWFHVATPQVGAAPLDHRYNDIKCKVCGHTFRYFYALSCSLDASLRAAGVPSHCK